MLQLASPARIACSLSREHTRALTCVCVRASNPAKTDTMPMQNARCPTIQAVPSARCPKTQRSADALGIGCPNLWLQPCGAATGHFLEEGIEAYLDQPLCDSRPGAAYAHLHSRRRVGSCGSTTLKAAWAERTRQVLVVHYPLVAGKIEFVNVSTPLTIEHFLPSVRGCISLGQRDALSQRSLS